jgi:hypothetical protein
MEGFALLMAFASPWSESVVAAPAYRGSEEDEEVEALRDFDCLVRGDVVWRSVQKL